MSTVEAAVRAAHDRLRPILMTSFAFILGSVPLVLATGAGAELRQALGTAVFFGMIGVTGVRPDLHADLLRRLPRRRRPDRASRRRRATHRARPGRVRNHDDAIRRFLLAAARRWHWPPARPGRTMSPKPVVAVRRRAVRHGRRARRSSPTRSRRQLVAALRRSGARRPGRGCACVEHRHPRRRRAPRQGARAACARSAARASRRSASAGARQYGRLPGPAVPGEKRTDVQVDVGLDVAYEVDLFGRVSRSIEAARGDVGAAAADADAVRVAIVVRYGAAPMPTRSRRPSGSRSPSGSSTLLDQSLALTERRHQIGLATGLDTARIAALRDQRRAEIPLLQAERQAALFRLAT